MADDDYTPTTDEVRRAVLGDLVVTPNQFDCWLAAHDREVREQALREAADEMEAEYERRTELSGAYGQMKIRAALRMGAGMNRLRADRIARAGMNRDELEGVIRDNIPGPFGVVQDALDEYTRHVQAAALREAADEVGMHISLRLRADWLRDRADRIEKEADR